MTALHKKLDELRSSSWMAIVDEKVKSHLPPWLQHDVNVFWIQNPEHQKDFSTYQKLCSFLLQQGADRTTTLLAIGGGATTDLAGFAAATVLRGLNWISIPTSLLAMVDGSIGGKVAINTMEGKNLVGAFHQPREVLICAEFLTTLAESEILSGKGEILKYAFLTKSIADLVQNSAGMSEIAHACAQHKAEVVKHDFKEEGERIHLNLGHTLGHAFESTYKIPHGQAVVLGITVLFKMLDASKVQSVHEFAGKLGIPASWLKLPGIWQADSIISYLAHDKKRVNKNIRLVLLKSVGAPYVQEYPLDQLIERIRSYDDTKN